MTSIVLELQKESLDSSVPVADLLRKALVVARKLEINDIHDLLKHEMDGYPQHTQLPDYRIVLGEIRAFDPSCGWISIGVADDPETRILRTHHIHQSIREIEVLISDIEADALTTTYPLEIQKRIMGEINLPFEPRLHIGKSKLHSIVDIMRNSILNWSLELEERGVLGNDMSFTIQEKQQAASVNYYIGSVTGGVVGGDIFADTVQIGNYNSINQHLKELGVPQDQRNELEEIMAKTSTAKSAEKKSLIQDGLDWIQRNKGILGTFGGIIKSWFENQ